MADDQSQLERENGVDAATVLAAVADQVDASLPLPDRIVITQGTPREWAYRLYFVGRTEYEGGVISL